MTKDEIIHTPIANNPKAIRLIRLKLADFILDD
jgi:hypothetical protein